MKDIGILDPKGKNKNPLTGEEYSEKYKELANLWSKYPAYEDPNKVIETIKKHQVILVISGTGSGKTVLTPKYTLHAYDYDAKIAITLPKQIITKSAAEFAAATLDVNLCKEVGYKYRGSEECYNDKTKLLYATDGTIVSKLLNEPSLKEFNAVIVDEVHERKVQIDFLLYLLKNALHQRKDDFKVILMSATVDEKLFEEYFKDFKFTIVNLGEQKTNFPITSIFVKERPLDYLEKGMEIISDIIKSDSKKNNSEQKNILFFVTSANEAEKLCDKIDKNSELNLYCAPLYSGIDPSGQLVAQSKDYYKTISNKKFRIIVSTNVAESSLTVENIQYVIDSGYELHSYYDPFKRAKVLEKRLISKSSAIQRKGRVGRVSAGTVYHLYTEDDYNTMRPYSEPSIQTSNLTTESLKFLSLDSINNTQNLIKVYEQFIEPPTKQYIESAINDLIEYNLVDKTGEITKLGRYVSDLQLEPTDALAVIAAAKLGVFDEVYFMICLMEAAKNSMKELFIDIEKMNYSEEQKKNLSKKLREMKDKITSDTGDHMTLYKIQEKVNLKTWEKVKDNIYKYFLNYDVIVKATKYYQKMAGNLRRKLFKLPFFPDNRDLSTETKILTCFNYGYKLNSGSFSKNNFYLKNGISSNISLSKSSTLNTYGLKDFTYVELFINSGKAELNIVSKITEKTRTATNLLEKHIIMTIGENNQVQTGGLSESEGYETKEECEKNKKGVPNEKYKFLEEQQLIVDIVADREQLIKKLLNKRQETKLEDKDINYDDNIFIDKKKEFFDYALKESLFNYKNQEEAFTNTLNYLFEDMFMGIYTRIKDNKLDMYVPFYNINYKNVWGNKIKYKNYNSETENFKDFIRGKGKDLHGYGTTGLLFDSTRWNSNNCLIGNSYPIYISNTRLSEFKYMLEQVCKNRKIKDVEFFINKRDFPILRKDLEYPYPTVSKDKLPKFKYEHMIPILSVSRNQDNIDILIPTEDDINLLLNKFLPNKCENGYKDIVDKFKWDEKIPKAVFRGKLTGCGITTETNQRIKLAQLDYDLRDKDLMDAGITSWNMREKIFDGVVQYIRPDDFSFKKKDFMSRDDQYKHKYLLHVDGHVSAFRLLSELKSNSVVLKVESLHNYEMWFSKLLKPGKHYVSIKKDLSDLEEKILWCREHDKECQEIVENAHKLVNKYLTKDGLFDYMQLLLNNLPYKEENQEGGDNNEDYYRLKDEYKKFKGQIYRENWKIEKFNDKMMKDGKTIIIIPYRENKVQKRREQLETITKYFQDKLPNVQLLIVEQSDDNNKFNRGKLLNIGYDISKDKYNTFILHDVDMLPDDDLLELYDNKKPECILHLASPRAQKKYTYDTFLGGVVAINKEHFEKLNGYPNNFWGWGGEDEDLKLRILKNQICITRPNAGKYMELKHELTQNYKEFTFEYQIETIYSDIKDNKWKKNGIKDLDYEIINKKNINNAKMITVKI